MVKLKAEAKSKAFRIAKEHTSKPASHEAKQAYMKSAMQLEAELQDEDGRRHAPRRPCRVLGRGRLLGRPRHQLGARLGARRRVRVARHARLRQRPHGARSQRALGARRRGVAPGRGTALVADARRAGGAQVQVRASNRRARRRPSLPRRSSTASSHPSRWPTAWSSPPAITNPSPATTSRVRGGCRLPTSSPRSSPRTTPSSRPSSPSGARARRSSADAPHAPPPHVLAPHVGVGHTDRRARPSQVDPQRPRALPSYRCDQL